ncbi:MAG: HigA family addiction module antidote protein [Heliobacteriaceae bacterium]|jgi:addiction module HigA family antidote|nr:HigA family addiction module antidote protein [Heliobacteriaceae bacterium]
MEMYNPAHPGIILLEDWIKPMNFTISAFALRIGTSRKNLSEIVNGKAGISPEMALKLEKVFNNSSSQFWLDLQVQYDLWQAKQHVDLSNIQAIAM